MTQQANHLELIEQALRELDGEYQAGVREVQEWLRQHGVDLPLEIVKGNMQIVRQWLYTDDEQRGNQ